MITILHGDDTTASRNELHRLRQLIPNQECRVLEGKNVSEQELIQAIHSQSLFGENITVIIEQLFSSIGKKQSRLDMILSVLFDPSVEATLYIWEDKPLSKSVLSKVSKAKVLEYKLPSILFQFIDTFSPGHERETLTLFHTLINQQPIELIHALLGKRLRQLIALKSGKNPIGLQPWQISRLTKQGTFFTMNGLLRTYRSFIQNDLQLKTGTAYLSLEEATERMMTEMKLWQ